ncbi:hypothetical protein SIXOD_v1c16340 [Spiroplasma ixodetis Y32]|nr:hypothetical protein SIXOD_v1c16340 [Spiroplasma ixodetis Y32]
MKYVYLLKYEVNYTGQIKYKVFSTIENANNYHRNYWMGSTLLDTNYVDKWTN